MKTGLLFILLIIFSSARAQNSFSCLVKDQSTGEKLAGVTATVTNTRISALSDNTGKIILNNIPQGTIKISFSHIGYKTRLLAVSIPDTLHPVTIILMVRDTTKTEAEVIVSSSRTNSRIEDLPTKVEVIGSEEVNEENGIKPGNITSLLGDVAGIQIQQTSAATGNAEARIQGLPGKYTQILRDGLPLFGGYSGNFGVLQIPPLDLKQIEIIKGASSTLYGGGAIAGLLNIISKSPQLNKPERSITVNQSSLNESNLNVFLSKRNKKMGYTVFTGGTYQRAADVNKDGYSDVPDLTNIFFHPKLFFYPNARQTITVGYSITNENRKGGDMQVLHHTADAVHQFFIENKTLRNTIDAAAETKLNTTDLLTVKGTASLYNRQVNTNVFGMNAGQLAYFSELNYLVKRGKHNMVAGINFSGDHFRKKNPDSTRFDNYHYTTAGIFIQDDWKLTQHFITEAGLRLDNHNTYGHFILPRLSLLYKINTQFSTRLGGGMGYKIPEQFAAEVDERDYKNFYPSTNVRAEKSKGINWDINYKTVTDDWHLTVNQMFYFTSIDNPLVQSVAPNGVYTFSSAGKPLNTKGFETYIAAAQDELEIYLGYTYTVAKQLFDDVHPNVSLSARNKFAALISYEFTDGFRAGWETAYTGKQYLDNGNTTPGYTFAAAMIRCDIKNISFVLNCENLFDYRQTRQETIYSGSISNPVFKQIWAPLDGRVVNLSAKISW